MYIKMKVERLLVLWYETVVRFKGVMENIFLPKYALIDYFFDFFHKKDFL